MASKQCFAALKALTHLDRNLCPLVFGTGLQVFELGRLLGINFGLQLFPQILNGIKVWALAWQDLHVAALEPFPDRWGVIVLLVHPF